MSNMNQKLKGFIGSMTPKNGKAHLETLEKLAMLQEVLGPKAIESLTPEQEALFPVYRDRWLSIGLSTESSDKEKAEQAIDQVYRSAGMKPPAIKIWLQNPLEGCLASYCLESLKLRGYRPKDPLWQQLGDYGRTILLEQFGMMDSEAVAKLVGEQVRTQVLEQIWLKVRDELFDSIEMDVGELVQAKVWNPVRVPVWERVQTKIWEQVWSNINDVGLSNITPRVCYGSHDASWLCYYSYFEEVVGMQLEKLNGLFQAAHHCGWFWPFENAVILTEKPTVIRMRGGYIHAEGAAAIEYPGNFNVYAYDGIRLPEKYGRLDPTEWQVDWLLKERDAEVREALNQGIGHERLLQELEGAGE